MTHLLCCNESTLCREIIGTAMGYAAVIKMGTEVECIFKCFLFSAVVVGCTEDLFPSFEGRNKCPWCCSNVFFLGIQTVICHLSVPLQVA